MNDPAASATPVRESLLVAIALIVTLVAIGGFIVTYSINSSVEIGRSSFVTQLAHDDSSTTETVMMADL